jgi:hypothetical protein
MPPMIEQLLVIWGEPVAGRRSIIGRLARGGGQFRFWYESTLPFDKGFTLLPEFPEHRDETRPYVERYLFPLFAERIPSSARRDTKAMMDAWGVEHSDDQFEVLARSGGIRATDRIELAEYRSPDDELERPLDFRVAGRSRMESVPSLAVGDAVSLRADPTNPVDASAVVVDKRGEVAGYVPHQYTTLVGTLLGRGLAIDGRVARR